MLLIIFIVISLTTWWHLLNIVDLGAWLISRLLLIMMLGFWLKLLMLLLLLIVVVLWVKLRVSLLLQTLQTNVSQTWMAIDIQVACFASRKFTLHTSRWLIPDLIVKDLLTLLVRHLIRLKWQPRIRVNIVTIHLQNVLLSQQVLMRYVVQVLIQELALLLSVTPI